MKCPECDGELILKNSKYGMFWGCTNYPKCTASHGAHKDGRPFGIPADKETKQWRIKAHNIFDKWWKRNNIKRKRAYHKMADLMNMHIDDAHIGRFNIEQCEELLKKLKSVYGAI